MKTILFIACTALTFGVQAQSKKEIIADFERQIEALNRDMDQKDKEIERLKQENTVLAQERNTALASIKQAMMEKEMMQGMRKSQDARIDSLTRELNTCRSDLNMSTRKIATLEKGTVANPGRSGTSGSTSKRKRLNEVHLINVNVTETATIKLRLTIDADGNVTGVQNVKNGTTTNNESLIYQVADAVRKQVKYSKSPGAAPEKVDYTIVVKP